jgi:hypothetical protein
MVPFPPAFPLGDRIPPPLSGRLSPWGAAPIVAVAKDALKFRVRLVVGV